MAQQKTIEEKLSEERERYKVLQAEFYRLKAIASPYIIAMDEAANNWTTSRRRIETLEAMEKEMGV